jgi:signal transduction histidine kinase
MTIPSTQQLAADLQFSMERERAAISRELHDELGSALVSIKINLDGLRRRAASNEVLGPERFSQSLSVIAASIATMRRLVERLRPSILNHLGLFAALRWQLAESCTASGLQSIAHIPEEEPDFSPDLAILVVRILSEAIELGLGPLHPKIVDLDVRIVGFNFHMDIRHDAADALAVAAREAVLAALNFRAQALGGLCSWEGEGRTGGVISTHIPIDRLLRR